MSGHTPTDKSKNKNSHSEVSPETQHSHAQHEHADGCCDHNHDHDAHEHHDHDHGDHAHHDHGDHAHHDHAHHDHDKHAHHDHSDCGHDHHHGPIERFERAIFNAAEMALFSDSSLEQLEEGIAKFLTDELYGKAVVLQEFQVAKIPIENWAERTMAKYLLALTYGEIHESQKAVPLWAEVVSEISKVDEPWLHCEVTFEAGRALVKTHQDAQAQSTFAQGLSLAHKFELKAWQAAFEHEQGSLLVTANPAAAVPLLNSALNARREMADKGLIAASAFALGRAHQALNDAVKAKDLYEQALVLISSDEEFSTEKKHIEESLAELRNSELKKKLSKLDF